jgi:ATP-dependent Clp protease adaptor protein ClpS
MTIDRTQAMAPSPGKKQRDDGGVDVQEKPKTKQKLQRPKLYRVLLHNDDYTPRFFVVQILIHVFHKSESDAQAIMLHAESKGHAVAGVYTFEVAETKVAETMQLSSEAQYPLLCTMEPDEGAGE